MHPFLAEDFHVRWSTLVPEAVESDITAGLELSKKNIAAICEQDPDCLTYESTFLALEAATEDLGRGWGRLQHLDSVCDNPDQREALNKMLPAVSEFFASIPLNADLWRVLKTYGESEAVAELEPIHQRFVQETMEDFRESGADLPDAEKKRVAEIQSELSKLTKEYAEHVLDSTNAFELVITDEAKLAGLPESAKASAAANAKAKGIEGDAWRFTLQFPSMYPLMQYLEDDTIRKQVWEASSRVGSKGEHDNTAHIGKILELRQEKAEILGHSHFADLSIVRRMAKSGEKALEFVENLHDRIEDAFKEDYASLAAYKAKKTGEEVDALQPWETAFWAERRRKECYDLDDEVLRPYFSVKRVMSGMFDIASKLFGIRIEEKETVFLEPGSTDSEEPTDKVEVWHPEVKFYEIYDADNGRHCGSFYADWHPRESKRGGAWMNPMQAGEVGEPHLALMVGNMSPPVDGKAALLTHGEVETIFHEFGHLLHALLSEVEVKSLSGTNVPWDFVELPSQIMENYCWDRESLDLFARHHETGEVIAQELFEKMIAARNYMSASAYMRQLAFSKIDLELHVNPGAYLGRDLDEVDSEILADYHPPLGIKTPTMLRRFNHIFSSPTGYAAGYYSYKWAEVLDADAFTRFQKEGVLNSETGRSLRNTILSRGNSAPPEELYREFMGRDPDPEPLLVRAGLA